jgi:hypothetical protein
MATAACAIAAACFFLPRDRDPAVPIAASAPPSPPAAEAEDTLAVLVWYGGTPLFEKVDSTELGSIDLAFGLEPVIADPDEFWTDSRH